jgi:hypothetical protein
MIVEDAQRQAYEKLVAMLAELRARGPLCQEQHNADECDDTALQAVFATGATNEVLARFITTCIGEWMDRNGATPVLVNMTGREPQ